MKHFLFLLIIVFIVYSFFLVVNSAGAANSATITWNANTESDLAGYKIYYGRGTYSGGNWVTPKTGTDPKSCGRCGYPVSVGTGSRLVNNPISVGNVTTYTVNNLSNGRYFFSISAVDSSGNESEFSADTATAYKNSTGAADINADGNVNGTDFSLLLSYWSDANRSISDFNLDGFVGGYEFSVMMSQWTSP